MYVTLATALTAGGVIGSLCVIPFLQELSKYESNPPHRKPINIASWKVFGKTIINSILIFFLLVCGGLFVNAKMGRQVSLLIRVGTAGDVRPLLIVALESAGAGLLAGFVVAVLDSIVFWPYLPSNMKFDDRISLWKRLLAGLFYGGISEEILMRLFILSGLVWLSALAFSVNTPNVDSKLFWTCNLFTAALFGALHLPATARLTPLTPFLIIRSLLLNGIAGIVFGYLFWAVGIEAAIIGHASANVVLQSMPTLSGHNSIYS
jgi:membrane protease YdiL (CAAX protease family)